MNDKEQLTEIVSFCNDIHDVINKHYENNKLYAHNYVSSLASFFVISVMEMEELLETPKQKDAFRKESISMVEDMLELSSNVRDIRKETTH